MKRAFAVIAALVVTCVVSLLVRSGRAQAPVGTQSATAFSVTNASSTGTTVNTLTKLTGAPSTAVIAATTDNKNGAVIGITVSGAGTAGSAIISTAGMAQCVFDGATTAGDFVTVSTTTAGDCKDNAAAPPADGSQVIGRVLSTNGSAGTYNILLNPGIPVQGVWNGTNVGPTGFMCGTIAANGACANTAAAGTGHWISGIATLAANTSTITGISPAFTSSSSYFCVANDITTRANPAQAIPASGTTVTFTNTTGATDNIQFVCVGN